MTKTKKSQRDLVLSVRQPYAGFLVRRSQAGPYLDLPIKWCENRSWKPNPLALTPSKLVEDRGKPRILIHASGTMDQNAIKEYKHIVGFNPPVLSAIIGSVRLLGVIRAPVVSGRTNPGEVALEHLNQIRFEELKENKFALHIAGEGCEFVESPETEDDEHYWWLCDRPIEFKTPTFCKGSLGLWQHDGKLLSSTAD